MANALGEVNELIHKLIGCEWGRSIQAVDDSNPCPKEAIQIVAIHRNGIERRFKLCEVHRDRVLEQTTPHEVS